MFSSSVFDTPKALAEANEFAASISKSWSTSTFSSLNGFTPSLAAVLTSSKTSIGDKSTFPIIASDFVL